MFQAGDYVKVMRCWIKQKNPSHPKGHRCPYCRRVGQVAQIAGVTGGGSFYLDFGDKTFVLLADFLFYQEELEFTQILSTEQEDKFAHLFEDALFTTQKCGDTSW